MPRHLRIVRRSSNWPYEVRPGTAQVSTKFKNLHDDQGTNGSRTFVVRHRVTASIATGGGRTQKIADQKVPFPATVLQNKLLKNADSYHLTILNRLEYSRSVSKMKKS